MGHIPDLLGKPLNYTAAITTCVFAPMPGRFEAEAVLKQLPQGMRGRVVQGLDRHPLQDWLKEN